MFISVCTYYVLSSLEELRRQQAALQASRKGLHDSLSSLTAQVERHDKSAKTSLSAVEEDIRKWKSSLQASFQTLSESLDVLSRRVEQHTQSSQDFTLVLKELSEINRSLELVSQGWIKFPGNGCYYKLLQKFKDAENARKICRTTHSASDLVMIRNQGEFDFLQAAFNAEFWIGAYKSNNKWVWVDGSDMTFAKWLPGKPNNYRGENCASFIDSGWYDRSCSTHNHTTPHALCKLCEN